MTKERFSTSLRCLAGLDLDQLHRERTYWQFKLQDPLFINRRDEAVRKLEEVQAELTTRNLKLTRNSDQVSK